jgi:hypothetical protein
MNRSANVPANVRPLPTWLMAALASADADGGVLNKRRDARRPWSGLINAQNAADPSKRSFTVNVFNLSSLGLGIITRNQQCVGDRLVLTPVGEPGQNITVRVVHCTRTIQGFKVGCRFESKVA